MAAPSAEAVSAKRARGKAADGAPVSKRRIPMFSPEARHAPLRPLDGTRVKEGARKAQRHMAKAQEASSFEACCDYYLQVVAMNGRLYVSAPQTQTGINTPQLWDAVFASVGAGLNSGNSGAARRGENLKRFEAEGGYASTMQAIADAAARHGFDVTLANGSLPTPQLESKTYKEDRTERTGYVEKLDVLEVDMHPRAQPAAAQQQQPAQRHQIAHQEGGYTVFVQHPVPPAAAARPSLVVPPPDPMPMPFLCDTLFLEAPAPALDDPTAAYRQRASPSPPSFQFAHHSPAVVAPPQPSQQQAAQFADPPDPALEAAMLAPMLAPSPHDQWLRARAECSAYGLHPYDIPEDAAPLEASLRVLVCVR